MGNNLPTFLIVGTAKAGTTSLFYYLNQHPEVFIPDRKECRFFSQMSGDFQGPGCDYQNDIIRDIKEYQSLFLPAKNIKAKGDISNDYLFFYENSINNIKRYLGNNIKIVIVLRNPIDRVFSNYKHHVRAGWEKLSFEEALQAELVRKKEHWAWPWLYIECSKYYKQVRAYLENFTNVRIFLYEDLHCMPDFLKHLFEFIEVDSSFIPDISKKYNTTGIPKSKFLHNFLIKNSSIKSSIKLIINKILSREAKEKFMQQLHRYNLQKTPMKEETRKYLKDEFKAEILKLQKLIQRDLTQWIK